MANISFASSSRAEVCRALPHKRCCAQAACFGILLFCNSFQTDGIKIITESREFAYILPKLFKKAFDLDFDDSPRWLAFCQEAHLLHGVPHALQTSSAAPEQQPSPLHEPAARSAPHPEAGGK